MRVMQVMAGGPVGGAETFFVDAVKAIDELDIAQSVVTRNNNPQKIKEFENRNIPFKTASFNKLWKGPTRRAIHSSIQQFNPDIVHHWLGRAGTFAQHGTHANLGWYGGYYKPERYQNCHYHIAITQDIADHIVRQGIDAKSVYMLQLFAEIEKGAPLDRSEFDTPEGVPLLLALSRLHECKGLDVLIDAMRSVPEAYLWIAGDGPLKNDLLKQVKDYGLEDRIRFLGWRYDREALLATADAVVFPSRYESFGAVTIEAWASGTPLIAAKAAGPKAYVSHEENGLLVEIDDVAGLASAINRLIKDTDLQKHLTSNGLSYYESTFTKSVFQKNVQSLYQILGR